MPHVFLFEMLYLLAIASSKWSLIPANYYLISPACDENPPMRLYLPTGLIKACEQHTYRILFSENPSGSNEIIGLLDIVAWPLCE